MLIRNKNEILKVKARLLAGACIKIDIDNNNIENNNTSSITTYKDNHHNNEWIFLRLSESSRVRLTISDNARFLLTQNKHLRNKYDIIDNLTSEVIIGEIEVEEALVHAPKQLFLGLYEYCSTNCKFCPLSRGSIKVHYSLDEIFCDIDNYLNKGPESIGITTAIPPNLTKEDVGDELAFVIKKIRHKVGNMIPIGVSTKCPSRETLIKLKKAGANEIRLNLEVFNEVLSKNLMPYKSTIDIIDSIKNASEVFGIGKVSSNLIIGIGESDEDILTGIDKLASIGAIATLYPYDPIEIAEMNDYERKFGIPTAERLEYLAIEHKKILDKYKLDVYSLKTMCPSCAASHILPGRDF